MKGSNFNKIFPIVNKEIASCIFGINIIPIASRQVNELPK